MSQKNTSKNYSLFTNKKKKEHARMTSLSFTVFRNLQNLCSFPYCLHICFTIKEICWLAALVYSVSPKLILQTTIHLSLYLGDFSFSSCEETAVSEASWSIFKYESSPPKEDIYFIFTTDRLSWGCIRSSCTDPIRRGWRTIPHFPLLFAGSSTLCWQLGSESSSGSPATRSQ